MQAPDKSKNPTPPRSSLSRLGGKLFNFDQQSESTESDESKNQPTISSLAAAVQDNQEQMSKLENKLEQMMQILIQTADKQDKHADDDKSDSEDKTTLKNLRSHSKVQEQADEYLSELDKAAPRTNLGNSKGNNNVKALVLEDFLPTAPLQSDTDELVLNKEGTALVVKRSSRKVMDAADWIYANIGLKQKGLSENKWTSEQYDRFLKRAALLMKRYPFSTFIAWDRAHREHVNEEGLSIDTVCIDIESLFLYKTVVPAPAKSPTFHSSYSPSKTSFNTPFNTPSNSQKGTIASAMKGYCGLFHWTTEGCRFNPCKYKHLCQYCEGAHKTPACTNKPADAPAILNPFRNKSN